MILSYVFEIVTEIGLLFACRLVLFWQDHLRHGSSGEIARTCAGNVVTPTGYFAYIL